MSRSGGWGLQVSFLSLLVVCFLFPLLERHMGTMWNVECLAEFHCAAALFCGLLTQQIYGRLALLI